MTGLIAAKTTTPKTPRIAQYDLVRIPGGRIGSVLGFYRRAHAESALVWLSANESAEFLTTELALV
jgi:hypothetical protein